MNLTEFLTAAVGDAFAAECLAAATLERATDFDPQQSTERAHLESVGLEFAEPWLSPVAKLRERLGREVQQRHPLYTPEQIEWEVREAMREELTFIPDADAMYL